MTLPALYERIAGLPSAGYLSEDTRLDKGRIYSLIHSARAFIVTERWKQFGKIPPVYYQPFKPEYVILSQDSTGCFSRFYNIPTVIALDGRATGIGYIGSDGTHCMFREVLSRAAFAAMQQSRVMKAGRKAYCLTPHDGEMEVYFKDSIENFKMEAIFADPTTVNTYNVDYDNYPMDMSDIPKMETYLLQGAMGLMYRTPMDRVNDGRDTTVQPLPRV